jgi:putative transposase
MSSPGGTSSKRTGAPPAPQPPGSSARCARCPFPVRAVQVDGGSEFAAAFEVACQAAGIHLFVLPPRSPKLNGAVERAHRTHTEEFYQVRPFALELRTLNRQLVTWERIYNTLRAHQALGYLTPAAFLAQWQAAHPECH